MSLVLILESPYSDPDEDPASLLFFSAQNGSIDGMEKAISKDPNILFASDIFDRMSALHIAAASFGPMGVDAVRWLLKKGIPWSARDRSNRLPEECAREHENEESRMVLRNWAIDFGDVILIAVVPSSLPFPQNTSYTTGRTGRRTIQTMANLSLFCAWTATGRIKTSAIRLLRTSTHTERQKTKWHSSQATRPAS